jgi:transcriptional regulator of NAD metabolism
MGTYIEVTLDEFDTSDIVEHLESRGFKVIDEDADDTDAELMRVWAALRLNQNEEALRLMAVYVCDKLGRVL